MDPKTGLAQDYTGSDLYEPSEYVLEIVGSRFTCWEDSGPWLCTGYDPRMDFWMTPLRDFEGKSASRRDISSRAIGPTWHRVTMTSGAWRLLEMFETLNRAPTYGEGKANDIIVDLAERTLRNNGLIEGRDLHTELTERGKSALALPDLGRHWIMYLRLPEPTLSDRLEPAPQGHP